ncbi:MAG: NAD(P)H-dependent glycerol-3-phosphate dehydrogenase [Oligoflexia bacterium]|jgi:glycerol-3-phosphate dehydrogenase (NAD(P)+)
MTEKDFWLDARVSVIGAGTWGTVLAQLAAQNCREVRMWTRTEAQARQINATRINGKYVEGMALSPKILAVHEIERALAAGEGGASLVIWALPSAVTRQISREVAPLFSGREIVIHATKGIEIGTLKRMTEILTEELPAPRVGVLSGPNLALEVSRGEPAGAVVASRFDEVIEAGQRLLASRQFRVYSSRDVIGVEWAGTLKNVLAIAAGALDALGLGWNARSMLITRGLAEMVRFGTALGGEAQTFLGLAGMGDLMATCGSPLSRNYRVGARLAKGEELSTILETLGTTAEGVSTTRTISRFARERGISMPISEGVNALLSGGASVQQAIEALMNRPQVSEF